MSPDAANAFTWSEAGTADEDAVLALMSAFYVEERRGLGTIAGDLV